eukprot:1146604-Pelagomonas_calceolata.AAC.1
MKSVIGSRAKVAHAPQSNCNRRERVSRLGIQHTHNYHKRLSHPAIHRIQPSSRGLVTKPEPTHISHEFFIQILK